MEKELQIVMLQKRARRIFERCDARNVPILLPTETAELMQIDAELVQLGGQPFTPEFEQHEE